MPSIIEAWFSSSERTTQPGSCDAERAERRPVRHVAGGEEQRGLLAVQVGELALQQDVVVVGAGDVAGAAGAGAAAVERLVHGGEHLGVLAHAEIVVGAPDRDLAAVARRRGAWRGERRRPCARGRRRRGSGPPGGGRRSGRGRRPRSPSQSSSGLHRRGRSTVVRQAVGRATSLGRRRGARDRMLQFHSASTGRGRTRNQCSSTPAPQGREEA